ncbi:MAG: ATP synthase F1 subunit epsilon [Cyclonatronaceae bacterium]
MKAHILTPQGAIFEGEVDAIRLPGIEGGFEVLKDHSPLVSILDIGKLIVKASDESEKVFAISGGFTEIKDNNIIVLAEQAITSDKIDRDKEREKKKELEKELSQHKIFTDEHKRLQRELRIVKNRLKVAG